LNKRVKTLVFFGLAGLVGPLIGDLVPHEIGRMIAIGLWPTWMMLWFAVATPDASVMPFFGFVSAILGNVAVFTLLGWCYGQFQFKTKLRNYLAVIPCYAILYGMVSGIIYSFLRTKKVSGTNNARKSLKQNNTP
jgi:hypothetical protein